MITAVDVLCFVILIDCILLVLFAFDKISGTALDWSFACLNIGGPFIALMVLVVIT